jgi:hypothetical protein
MRKIKSWNDFSRINEWVSPKEMDSIERAANMLFADEEFDLKLSRHFKERANFDTRNSSPIEKVDIFSMVEKIFKNETEKIASMKVGDEGVITDSKTDLNVPFIIESNPRTGRKVMVLKTIMKKKDFKTPNQRLVLEKLFHQIYLYSHL